MSILGPSGSVVLKSAVILNATAPVFFSSVISVILLAAVIVIAVLLRSTILLRQTRKRLSDQLGAARDEVHKHADSMRNVIDKLPVGIICVDPSNHRILDVNPHAARLFGASREAVVGRVCHSVICPAQVGKCPITDLGKTVDHAERVLLTHDGGKIPVLKSVSQLINDGHPVLIESFLDLRTQKQAEKMRVARDAAEKASLAKSQFLANMSHELRTPLNAIIGYSEMLQEIAAESQQKELIPDLLRIQSAGRHLLSLISDILDLSKIEAGKMALTLEDFEVSSLVTEVANSMQALAIAKGNHLEIHCLDEIGNMKTDMTRLRQILINLLGNACKFTENGMVHLSAARISVSQRDWIVFRIEDSGIGIPPDKLELLFKPFSQADPTTTRKYGGTGLGLALCQQFCRMMGGEIQVESMLGKGSVFTVCLPAGVDDTKPTPDPDDEARTLEERGRIASDSASLISHYRQ